MFKMMVLSYCRYHEQNILMESCLGTLTARVQSLDDKISNEAREIREVLSIASEHAEDEMSVIMEEETERSIV
jgi:hypothetical protein